MAGSEELAAQDLHADIFCHPRFIFSADIAVEDCIEMSRVPIHVAGGEDRIFRDNRRVVLWRDATDFEIAALHRLDFRALREQRAVVVNLHVERAGRFFVQHFLEFGKSLGLPTRVRVRGRNAKRLSG